MVMTIGDAKCICMETRRGFGGICGMGACSLCGLCSVLGTNNLIGYCQSEDYEDYEQVDNLLREYLKMLSARVDIGMKLLESGRYDASGMKGE